MDAYDLFKQLTRGAKFTTKKDKKKEVKAHEHVKQEDIKKVALAEKTEVKNVMEATEFEYLKHSNLTEVAVPKKRKRKQELSAEEIAKKEEEERVIKLRKEKQITVYGKDVVNPIESFEELRTRYKVSERLVQNLQAAYAAPTAIQMQAIPNMLESRPVMACAPTGSGKTVAFLTPIVHDLHAPKKQGFRALILAPTRELAQQIFRECARLCEKTALKIHIMEAKAKPLAKKYDILITTPNRVRHMLMQEPPMIDLSQ